MTIDHDTCQPILCRNHKRQYLIVHGSVLFVPTSRVRDWRDYMADAPSGEWVEWADFHSPAAPALDLIDTYSTMTPNQLVHDALHNTTMQDITDGYYNED